MSEPSASSLSLTDRLRAYRAAAAPHVARVSAVARHWGARSWTFTQRAARKAAVLAKRGFLATLEVIEKTLLSHSGRERTQAVAVFTLIFAFAVTSVDFLLTGGPEFSQGARAATYTSQASLISARSPAPMGELAYAAPIETTIEPGVIEEAVVTPLSARAPAAQVAGLADAAEPPKPELERAEAPASQPTKAKDEA